MKIPSPIPLHRKCIFCSNKADTKEHWPPKWMQGTIHFSTSMKHTVSYGEDKAFTGIAHQNGIKARSLKIVCADCNNGWMSVITNQAKRAIMHINYFPNEEINSDIVKCLVDFSILETMIIELFDYNTISTTSLSREMFKKGTLCDDWIILAALHKLPKQSCSFNHCAWNPYITGKLYDNSVEIQNISLFDAQMTVFEYGNLILVTLSSFYAGPLNYHRNLINYTKFSVLDYFKSDPIFLNTFEDSFELDKHFRTILPPSAKETARPQWQVIDSQHSGRRRNFMDFGPL